MYRCLDCEHIFEQPKIKKTSFEAEYGIACMFDNCTPLEIKLCPHCQSPEMESVEECSRCGRYSNNLTKGLCDECYGEMYED